MYIAPKHNKQKQKEFKKKQLFIKTRPKDRLDILKSYTI